MSSGIDFNAAKTAYQAIADELITEVNKTVLTLYFSLDTVSPIVESDNLTLDYNRLGGRTPLDNMDNRSNQTSATGVIYKENISSTGILVRAYWESKTRDNTLPNTIADEKSLCKIICFTDHVQLLRNAYQGEANGKKIKMIRDPVPHGLFGEKRYSKSYWEIID